MVHVGVLINNGNQFTNGSEQQPYFVVEVLRAMGIGFTLYTHVGSKDNGKSGLARSTDFHGVPLQSLSGADVSHVTTFIMICHVVDSAEGDVIRDKLSHCKTIQFHCGNHCYFNAEDVLFEKHDVVKLLRNSWFTETWVFPMHAFASAYYKHLTGKPTKTMPYVWSPTLFDKYCLENNLDVHCDAALYSQGKPLTLCCFEPNLNITKTCLVPLLIMNSVYKRSPDLVSKCLLFCAEHLLKRKSFVDFVSYLEIASANKLEVYPRIPFPNALAQMKEKGLATVIIGHQIANEQNYMYYESLHLAYPLVHNCPCLETAGMYYADWAVDTAVEKVMKFQVDFEVKHAMYKDRAHSLVASCSPSHPTNVMAFRRLIA